MNTPLINTVLLALDDYNKYLPLRKSNEGVGGDNIYYSYLKLFSNELPFFLYGNISRVGFLSLKFIELDDDVMDESFMADLENNKFDIFKHLERILLELVDDMDLCSTSYEFNTDHMDEDPSNWTIQVNFTD